MAVALVQHVSAAANSATFASRPVAGNCLFACVQGYGASSVGSVKLGSLAENWTALATVSGGGQVAAIWMDPGCGSASSAVTFTASGAVQQNIQAYEFSGLGTSPSADVTPATFLASTAPNSLSWSSGTTATAGAADLWLGMYAGNNGGTYGVSAPGSPWACPESVTQQVVSHVYTRLGSGYQIPGAAGGPAFSGTQSSNGTFWAALAVALAPGAGAGSSGGSGSFLSFF